MNINFKPIIRKVIETEYGDFDFEEVHFLLDLLTEEQYSWDPSIVRVIDNLELKEWLLKYNIMVQGNDGMFYQGPKWKETYEEITTDMEVEKKLTGRKFKYD